MTPTSMDKKNKKPGPVRTGLVTVITLFIIIWTIYCEFFFDSNLRSLLQYVLTKSNGAEVNIGLINTSLWNLSLQVNKLEMTNSINPKLNYVEFDLLNFKMKMDALLRGKILIEDASLLGIRFNSLRNKPGFIVPPEPKKPEDEKPSPMMNAVMAQKESWMKNEYETSVISDIVSLLQSDDFKSAMDESLKDLESEKLVNSLLDQWPEKRKSWNSKFEELKKDDKLKNLLAEAKSIKPDKNPKEILEQVKHIKELKKKAKTEFDSYKTNYSSLTKEIQEYRGQVVSIPEKVKVDIDSVKQKLKVPTFDAKKSGQQIFQRLVLQYAGPYVPYIEKLRPYWESKKESKENRPKPSARGKGVFVHFPITKGYPTFWLKNMAISSDSKGKDAYALMGQLKNVTTHPKIVDKPIDLILKGDLISQKVRGIDALLSVDLRGSPAIKITTDVGSFPIENVSLSKTEKVLMNIDNASAKMNFGALFESGNVDLKAKFDFSETKWNVKTEKETLTKTLDTILTQMTNFYVLASMKGRWTDSEMDIDTDFIDRFTSGIKGEIEKKLNDMKNKIEEKIKSKISGKQSELVSKLSTDQKELVGPLLSLDVDKTKSLNSFDQIEQDLEKKAKEKGKETFNKEFDQLKKKIKLPF